MRVGPAGPPAHGVLPVAPLGSGLAAISRIRSTSKRRQAWIAEVIPSLARILRHPKRWGMRRGFSTGPAPKAELQREPGLINYFAAKLRYIASRSSRAPMALAIGTLVAAGAASAGDATSTGSLKIGATVENNCAIDTTGTGLSIVCRGASVKTELGESVNTADVTITYTLDSGANTATITYSP